MNKLLFQWISILFLPLFFSVFCNAAELVFRIHETENPPAEFTQLSYQTTGDVWYESEYWTGPDWTRIGRHWHHPGNRTDAVRTFIAPADGKVKITGPVRKLHREGDGVVVSILHNDKRFWSEILEGNDGVGKNPELKVTVHANDTIRFVVNRRNTISCDTTGWEPVITYLDTNQVYAATEAFGKEQGNGGWYYEMIEAQTPEKRLSLDIALEESAYREICRGFQHFPDREMMQLLISDWLQNDRFFRANLPVAWERAAPWVARSSGHQDAETLHEATPENLSRCVDQFFSEITRMIVDYRACGYGNYETERKCLHDLVENVLEPNLNERDWQILYLKTHLLKRELFFSQPDFNIGELLFTKRRNPSYSHHVGQYFGWRQRPGGGIYILENPGYSLACRDLIRDKLPPGNILEPRLSQDASRIAFSYVDVPPQVPDWLKFPVNEEGENEFYYHLYEINVDGTGLRQLTDGCYDDMMPEYLPDGDLAFVSTRRRAYSRCFGPNFSRRWHSYTLYRMNADSGEMFPISFNDVNEWFPAVGNDGSLLFARWDYIDRDAVTHQNLWAIRPDGTNPKAVWGNAIALPHCTFQAKPIPDSNKIMFIASAHHSITGGPVCVVDPSVDANSLDAVTRLTPGPFPEAESWNIPEYYNSPWPLSEKLFLVAYSRDRLIFEPEPNTDNALGLYLMDDRGNRELIYRDAKIGSTCPTPVRPVPVPPVISRAVEYLAHDEQPVGEMTITNVYAGLESAEPGSLKQIRVVQIFPKTTWISNDPQIGAAGEENARAILGVAPIEEDGSARFLVPAGKPLLFQVLDENGFAYQTMRSTTSVMPGEQTSCVGCHEYRMSAAPTADVPLALRHPPSPLEPTPESGRPYGFAEMAQPILDRKCVECHNDRRQDGGINLSGTPKGNYTESYFALCLQRPWNAQNPAETLVPRFVQRNQIQTTPVGGQWGARESRLMQLLQDEHGDVQLTQEEIAQIGTWIDMNALFYGTYDQDEMLKQVRGEAIPMPVLQ